MPERVRRHWLGSRTNVSGGGLKTDISENEFRQALQIDHRFEWPDGDFEFWIVWDSVTYLIREHFGDECVDACEMTGKIGDEKTDEAWRRGMALAEDHAAQRYTPFGPKIPRLAYRVRQAPK